MSVRWMAVQYVGSTLRLPIVNEGDLDKPIGSSRLETAVKRIEVRNEDGEKQTFVPESLISEKDSENAKLRELISLMAVRWLPNDVRMTLDEWHERDERIRGKLLELGIEVDE